MIQKISTDILNFSESVQNFCKLKYPQHPNGCPNYSKKECCPPNQPLIDKVLDLSKDIYVIYTKFPIGEFAEKMKREHPDWTVK